MSDGVAPFAGACVETNATSMRYLPVDLSLPSRERVLKLCQSYQVVHPILSLPSRERVLKQSLASTHHHPHKSLPSRERVLKLATTKLPGEGWRSLPSRERVLKQLARWKCMTYNQVAPFAGACVETTPDPA